jgi:hypothetical protein
MSDNKKAPMLHEILAVEVDVQGVANKIIPEAIKTFSDKATHFTGSHRTLKMFSGDASNEAATAATEKAEEQHLEMVTTVHEKLQYVLDGVTRYYDVVLQKEATNQDAVADLVLTDGTVLAEKLPVGFLLGMETKLKALRTVYEVIPTLAPGINWVPDSARGKHVFRQANAEVRAKTAKEIKHKVLVAPTDKHPAQIEKWEETVNVGTFTKETWSSAMTTTEKSALLGRLDDLIQATKQARMRANATPVRQTKIGQKLISFLHPEGF